MAFLADDSHEMSNSEEDVLEELQSQTITYQSSRNHIYIILTPLNPTFIKQN